MVATTGKSWPPSSITRVALSDSAWWIGPVSARPRTPTSSVLACDQPGKLSGVSVRLPLALVTVAKPVRALNSDRRPPKAAYAVQSGVTSYSTRAVPNRSVFCW